MEGVFAEDETNDPGRLAASGAGRFLAGDLRLAHRPLVRTLAGFGAGELCGYQRAAAGETPGEIPGRTLCFSDASRGSRHQQSGGARNPDGGIDPQNHLRQSQPGRSVDPIGIDDCLSHAQAAGIQSHPNTHLRPSRIHSHRTTAPFPSHSLFGWLTCYIFFILGVVFLINPEYKAEYKAFACDPDPTRTPVNVLTMNAIYNCSSDSDNAIQTRHNAAVNRLNSKYLNNGNDLVV